MNDTKPLSSARQLTPHGRGAVATIVLHGALEQLSQVDRLFAAVNGKRLEEQPVHKLAFGYWGVDEPLEDVLLCRTADMTFEVHCHGGTACVERVLADLEAAGVQTAGTEPFSMPAELQAAVTRASTLRSAHLLLQQQRAWPVLAQSLIEAGSCQQIADSVRGVLEWTEFGLHLTTPWQIAIVGEPNVGKSTLLNALLGFERAIVFDQPGTTRDVVSARTVFDGWPVLVSDTAGIRETSDAIESSGVLAAQARADAVDVRLIVTDVGDPDPVPLDVRGRIIRVGNKSDTADSAAHPVDICVSATTGQGIDALVRLVADTLVPRVPEQQCVPVCETQMQVLQQILEICGREGMSEHDRLEAVKDIVLTRLR